MHGVARGLLSAARGLLLWAALLPLWAAAQTPLDDPDLGEATLIAPCYFGPNAFAVPEMLDGSVSPYLEATVGGDGYLGRYGDRTIDAFARLRVPVFTSRINLVLWMPVIEGYHLSERWKQHARLTDTDVCNGSEWGDVYVSADVLLMRETRRRPAFAIRAALKTASGGEYFNARYFDCPGYFFDASFGKERAFSGRRVESLRLGVSGGFLCWQTDNGRQNDAVMYAAEVKAKFHSLSVLANCRGYAGWEHQGDCPCVLKVQLEGRFGHWRPYVAFEEGLHDYPFHHLATGLTVDFDILNRLRK